jgi:hypothetical protein
MDRLIVAGGMFVDHNGENGEFKLVGPTKGIPYVRTEEDACSFHNLTKHHSHLYAFTSTEPREIELKLFAFSGECHKQVLAPKLHKLDSVKSDMLREAVRLECEENEENE